MLKKILKYSALALVMCYILTAMLIIPGKDDDKQCNGILVSIKEDKSKSIGKDDIIELLKEEGLDPIGKELGTVKCFEIENYINSLSLVKSSQAYKTRNRYINLEIICREPVLAIIDKEGRKYCIDNEGAIIDGTLKMLHLPIATGNIVDSMATAELKEIANAISSSTFWKAQTEQIYFDEKRNVILVPRVGDHIIELGKAEDIAYKLDKVQTFYKKGLSIIGWNKYSKLNVEFGNKVICTERGK